MPKVLNIVSRGTPSEGWSPCEPFSENDIKKIPDPAGSTDKKQITSIPSPFARIDLFKTAYGHIVDDATDNPSVLKGRSMHHKLISDSLDVLQIFFEWDAFQEGAGANLKILTWNREENIQDLIASGNAGHRLLGETLELFFAQDQETYNFADVDEFFLIEYDYTVIGGTSPTTMTFTTANNLSHVNLNIGADRFFDSDYRALHEREEEFQKFLHLFFEVERDLKYKMKEVFDYLELSLKQLSRTNRRLHKEITNAKRKLDVNEFKRKYPVLNTGREGQNVYVIGIQMRKKRVDKGSITEDSDFVIDSSKWERNPRNKGKHQPLVLQNNFSKRRFNYVNGGHWERNTEVPYTYGATPLDKRILPGQSQAYPHLTVDDFLEPYLVELIYPLNTAKFFDGNMVGFAQEHVGYLLPIKRTYFEYFDIEDLRKTTMNGGQIFEISERSQGAVAVTLRVPIKRQGEYISFERIYYPDARPKISASENKGAISKCQFGVAIFPFVRLDKDNRYRVVLIDRDIRDWTRDNDYLLQFYDQKRAEKALETVQKNRSDKRDAGATSKFYEIINSFDFVEIDNGIAKGLLIPYFENISAGNKGFKFSVDFGTTNSHIEFSIEGGNPQGFEITEDDIQYHTTFHPDDNIARAPEIKTFILQQFLPQIISNNTTFKFPFRTSTAEQDTLNHSQATYALMDVNIPFFYEKQVAPSSMDIHKELKWSNYSSDFSAKNRVQKFIETLLFLMRNKVILNKGNLSRTEVIWFYPSSMTPEQQDQLEDLWNEQFRVYFPEVMDPDVNLQKMSESLAPFHYYQQQERVDSLAYPVVSIDIGGGTSDIVVFKNNEPLFISSVRFAGNAIFGDGYNSSPRYNGFVRGYKEKIRGILSDNGQYDLLEVLKTLENESSQEIISFFFSLEGNQRIRDEKLSNTLSFSKMLKTDENLKIVFLVFYGALIYHVAKMMKKAGMSLPRYFCFSGNGSRSINIVDSNRRLQRISRLAQIIFEEVYNEEVEKKEDRVRYGGRRQPRGIEIKQVKNPKEITCKGGLLGAVDSNLDEMKLILLGTKDDKVVNSYIYQLDIESDSIQYDQLDEDMYDSVIEEVKEFIDLLFSIDRRYSLSRNFGIRVTEIDRYKQALTDDLLQYLRQGIELKKSKDLNHNHRAQIEETLFFYPLIGALNNLASKVAGFRAYDA